jgi:glyceraldehyde 3-phosphate dehydrogenase
MPKTSYPRVAINGFGRVGRNVLKAIIEKRAKIEVVAVNDLTDPQTLAHLLKYDTVYGHYQRSLRATRDAMYVDGKKIIVLSEKDPRALPWADLNIDVVIESTGRFRTEEAMQKHIDAGARRVVLSAPSKGGTVPTFVMGVNQKGLKPSHTLMNNASCTTNCIAPVAQVMHAKFGVAKALMTTIHGYTAGQNLQDGPHKDRRRARAAALNIIPTTTGAAIATTETLPALKGIFDGMAVRVPVAVGSLSDFTFLVKKKVTTEKVNQAFRDAAKNVLYKGILTVTEEPIVSSDIIGNSHSSIVDLGLTKVVDGDLVKVIAWYDNEWGYANRLAEIVEQAAAQVKK